MRLNKFEIDNLIKDNTLLKEQVKQLKLDKEALTKQLSMQGVVKSFCECKGSGGVRMDGTCSRCTKPLKTVE